MIGSNKVWDALSHYVFSPLNKTEGYEAIKDPSIVHFSCCWPKVWTNGSKNLFKNDEISDPDDSEKLVIDSLNNAYGRCKFIVMVPSIAIRE